jgi:group I intron endonuclease
MNSGVYLITNTLNGKQYVGQSTGIKRRFTRHKRAARTKHKRESFYLHNAIAKYGVENFTFEVLLYADDAEFVNLMEQRIIAGYNTLSPFGYNLDTGGGVSKKLSAATRKKLTGRTAWNKGVPATEEQKKKQSAAMLGKPSPQKGKARTQAEKDKQSVAMKGRPAWNKGLPMADAQREKLRGLDKSYTKTPEYRKMMSEAVKKAKAAKKETLNG